jgi:hypothetical protein
MFQRNHQISDELSRKMRNLQLFSTENKLKSRVSQMLQLDAVQATKTLKFKDAGKKVKGMLRAHKLGFGPMSEDEREDTRQMIKVLQFLYKNVILSPEGTRKLSFRKNKRLLNY